MKNRIKQMALLIGIALTVSAQAQTRMPKPVTDNLPGLPDQTVEWWTEYRKAQAEQKALDEQTKAANGESNFYTGKPYDADLGGYVFKYRNYSPTMQRWTTADPSGFPDGANNYCYLVVPISGLDPLGLEEVTILLLVFLDGYSKITYSTTWFQTADCDVFKSNGRPDFIVTAQSLNLVVHPHIFENADIFIQYGNRIELYESPVPNDKTLMRMELESSDLQFDEISNNNPLIGEFDVFLSYTIKTIWE
ncbi:MAG: hypothetical protein LBD30_06660 [Verrucomicrobiales bacterium]|jgi:RHS repeat-associated protein|nr:hypothetical protein [Verrucomicrobiales bacterium]